MKRRTFLQAVGAGSPLWLFSLTRTIRPDRSQSVRDVAPRTELARCDACGDMKGVVVRPFGSAKVARNDMSRSVAIRSRVGWSGGGGLVCAGSHGARSASSIISCLLAPSRAILGS